MNLFKALKLSSIFLLILLVGCDTSFSRLMRGNNPYEELFSKLENLNLTDTVLIQSQTKVFGCGTAAHAYYKDIKESELNKFYERYGNIFSDTMLLKQFEKKNKTKIIWVSRGNEGEFFEFENISLKENTKLFNALLKRKHFIKFDDTPRSQMVFNVDVTIVNPIKKETEINTYSIGLNHAGWSMSSIDKHKITGKEFESGYNPF